MYDPLANGFGSDDLTPGWPTTPHPANAPIPNLKRSTTPRPSSSSGSTGGPVSPFGKEPQIYGQPEPGLVSPQVTKASNGTKFEKPGAYLRVRITGLDRNRRDVLVRFDAQTNLSNFTGTAYRNVQRSYVEFQQFCESLVHSCPQTIVPALPFAQTSAPTDEEDDRLVKIMLQRWITRVCEDPILLNDEELRSFVESDFGYQPTPRARRKAGSGFSLMRRGVPDEDEELQKARFELTKLEGQFFDSAKAVDKLTRTRKSLALAHAEMGNKLINVATTEAHPHLANALRKTGRTWHSLADLDQAQAISECVILGDSLGYQGLNSRSAKETLQLRTAVLEEYQAAVKTTISKRRNIERLKASSNIRPEKADEAVEEMEEAKKYEQILAKRADGISQNLHRALAAHQRLVSDDITAALVEHVRSSIMYEKQLLRELEALRPDIVNSASRAPAPTKVNGAPRPMVVPPLEDDLPRPAPPSVQSPSPRLPIVTTTSPLSAGPSPVVSALASPSISSVISSTRSSFSQAPQSPGAGPSSPSIIQQPRPMPFSAAPSKNSEPPLGGRFTDGSRSMFITPTARTIQHPISSPASPLTPGLPGTPGTPQQQPAQQQRLMSPAIRGLTSQVDPLNRAASAPIGESSPLGPPVNTTVGGYVGQGPASAGAGGLDPLGQMRAGAMSASMRLPPTRSRLDAREAASKLANMF